MAAVTIHPRMSLTMLQEVVNSPTISIDKKLRTVREELEILKKEQELIGNWLGQLYEMWLKANKASE